MNAYMYFTRRRFGRVTTN